MTEINDHFQRALDFVRFTKCSIFLTGKAGTGKTTFLQQVKKEHFKKTVVVAPTGVAAIHAGGTTIHSFFQLPFTPFIPEDEKFSSSSSNITKDRHSLLGQLRLSADRREVMQQLELLIIDEISMVRCDVLDAIDIVLRHVRSRYQEAFGGVQVLFIGDLYQLPPVAKEEEWQILSVHYASPFFFDSQVMRSAPPLYLSLEKVYRQKDAVFVDLLNKVRNNQMDQHAFEQLHQRYLPDFSPSSEDSFIILTTHNYKADTINETELGKLDSREFTFEATIEGEFSEKSYPADSRLCIKTGAQVMFIKNDTEKEKRFFNGKIGVVKSIDENKIVISCEGDDDMIEVNREVWKNIRYKVNPQTGKVEEEEIGSFTQFPVRLAWAITIHKSQGLTFEKAIIDAGDAFAPGQVYVALSRCTQLGGMVLKSKIHHNSIRNDERIDAFAQTQLAPAAQISLLEKEKIAYRHAEIVGLFEVKKIRDQLQEVLHFLRKEETSFTKGSLSNVEEWEQAFQSVEETNTKFEQQLHILIEQDKEECINPILQERIIAACRYFSDCWKKIKASIEDNRIETDNRTISVDFSKKINRLYLSICEHIFYFEGHQDGFSTKKHQALKQSFLKPELKIQVYSGNRTTTQTDPNHQVLYNLLRKKRDAICEINQTPVYMVAGTQSLKEMCLFLPQTKTDLERISGFGHIKIRQYGEDFLSIIREYCEENDYSSNISSKEPIKKKRTKNKEDNPTASQEVKINKPDTKKISFDLYQEGKTVPEIATFRQMAISTIEGHLAHYISRGELKIDSFVPPERINMIREAITQFGADQLSVLKSQLTQEISYGDIRMVMAFIDSGSTTNG